VGRERSSRFYPLSLSRREEQDTLARAIAAHAGNVYARHLLSRLALRNYQRIANDVARYAAGKRLLDWGAGFGQMAFLLRRRGVRVVAYDYAPGQRGLRFGVTALDASVPLLTSGEPVALPFRDASFDVALSCGVLEHVGDEAGSLAELRRVLRPGGLLAIYQLPQQWSYLEFVVRRLRLGYAHPRRYTLRGARRLLAAHGFRVVRARRANMLPKTLTGLPPAARRALDIAPGVVLAADRALAALPGLNQLAGVLELAAVATDDGPKPAS
jgi:ubiquinone/menaquinone biosynthesis C-methylase UbiE